MKPNTKLKSAAKKYKKQLSEDGKDFGSLLDLLKEELHSELAKLYKLEVFKQKFRISAVVDVKCDFSVTMFDNGWGEGWGDGNVCARLKPPKGYNVEPFFQDGSLVNACMDEFNRIISISPEVAVQYKELMTLAKEITAKAKKIAKREGYDGDVMELLSSV